MIHQNFYPRSPCGERPLLVTRFLIHQKLFLSTLSLRRATVCVSIVNVLVWHFYPRSPCGERRIGRCRIQTPKYFYPRSPCGERHISPPNLSSISDISIHALLAESDQAQGLKIPAHSDFYPRSPCGERHIFFHKKDRQSSISIHALLAESDHRAIDIQSPTTKFLSTLSLRRATNAI